MSLCAHMHGRNFVPKSRGYIFGKGVDQTRHRMRREKWGAEGGGIFHYSLLTLEKAHFGGYLMHFDILILTLCFAVHRMLQGCVTDSVSSPTCCSSCGGLAPDKLCPCLCPFSSTRFPSPPILFLPFSFLTKLTRCSYTAACSL